MAIGQLTTGATQGGPITQMVARGAADFHLTGVSKVTYWRMRHTTHTNFATEMILQGFQSGGAQFGGPTAVCQLARAGDLAHRQYVVMDFPGLYPQVEDGYVTEYAYTLDATATAGAGDYLTDEELQAGLSNQIGGFYAHWTNAVGYAALSAVRLIVGQNEIDTLYREYLYMYEEFTGKAGKRLQDMIGKFETREQLIAYSRKPQRMYAPLPWWYTQVSGNALSLVSLPYNGVQVAVDFAPLTELIIVSNKDVKVFKTNAAGAATSNLVKDTDLQACLLTEYVFLDVAERNRFREGLFDQLISTVQFYDETQSNNTTTRIELRWNNPVIEMYLGVRLKANEVANRWFDFSRVGPAEGSGSGGTYGHPVKPVLQPQTEGTFDLFVEPETVAGVAGDTAPDLVSDNGMFNLSEVVTVNADPITLLGFQINGVSRYANMEGKFYRQVMPYQHHTNIPKNFFYNIPFALFPEQPNPSGSLNWSRLDNGIVEMTFHDDIVGESLHIMFCARNWNIFSYVEGIGGRKFQ